jgi:hypothetical protein
MDEQPLVLIDDTTPGQVYDWLMDQTIMDIYVEGKQRNVAVIDVGPDLLLPLPQAVMFQFPGIGEKAANVLVDCWFQELYVG